MSFPLRTRTRGRPSRNAGAIATSAPAPSFDPLVDITWAAAYFAEDPDWTPPADGGAVSQWDDGSGNARHVSQGTGTARPTYRASVAALNGKPAVQWDGTSDVLSSSTFTAVTQPWSWVIVADATGAAAVRRAVSNNGGTSWVRRDVTTDDLTVNPGTSNVTAAGTLTGAHLLIGVGNGASSAAILDGTSTTGGSGTATWTIVHLGASSAATEVWAGHIAFAGLYSGDITGNAKYADLKTWVAAHYGFAVA